MTDIDLDTLTAEAAQAEQRATEARATMREQLATDAAERGNREQEWKGQWLAGYSLDADNARVAKARADARAALRESALGRALLELAIAERVAHSDRAYAAHVALELGIDPMRVAAHNPLQSLPQRLLTDPVRLLVDTIAEVAGDELRAHEVARIAALEGYGSDGGRITAATPAVEVIVCGACGRPVPADAAYFLDGNPFHSDDACRPTPQTFPSLGGGSWQGF